MADEQIRIMCPSLICRKILAVPVSARGKSVKGRSGGTVVKVPDKPAAKKANGTGKQANTTPGEPQGPSPDAA